MTSVIPVWCFTNWATKLHWKQVRCEFNLYLLYDLYACTCKLLYNCEDHFHFYSSSAVHSYDLYCIHIMSYNGYKLNSHLTCFQWGFIAQLVEHCTGIVEDMGPNPVGASEFFLGFICNCLSYFITVLWGSLSLVISFFTHCIPQHVKATVKLEQTLRTFPTQFKASLEPCFAREFKLSRSPLRKTSTGSSLICKMKQWKPSQIYCCCRIWTSDEWHHSSLKII